MFANVRRHVAEALRSRHEGHSRTAAALTSFNDNGHLRSGHSGVAETCRRQAAGAGAGAVRNWNVLERNRRNHGLQVVDSMVARDGIEPPTPAFSERAYLEQSTTYRFT